MAVPDRLPVAVVGGGLGGTVAAILLEQAGYDVRLYEQTPKLARIGAGINLSSNATRVIQRCGLLERMTRQALVTRSFRSARMEYGRVYFRAAL